MGAPEGDHEVGASPPPALGVAATKVGVLRGIFQGVLLGAGWGHPAALRDLCQGAPPYPLGPAPVHPIRCKQTIKIIWMLQGVITNATWFQTVVT